MKKILITGTRGYVGTNFKLWLKKWPEKYSVKSVSLKNDDWKKMDFSEFDIVLHLAGIVHSKKIRLEQYYKVNSQLTEMVAQKAAHDGVKQFIFLSSMSVYGNKSKIIDTSTKLSPSTDYGKSKKEAEDKLLKLSNTHKNLVVTIIRPPMIYGKGSPGNYQRLSKLASFIKIFPYIKNERSMIYIENLNIYIKNIIDYEKHGIHNPQNISYVSTVDLIKEIAKINENKVIFIPIPKIIAKLMLKSPTLNKLYSDLKYSYDFSLNNNFKDDFIGFEESIKRTEEK
ncbi:NAD-dependent epimerase [Exiguobacterium sp. N4-1P]|uniref:NAD-dependent epimerase/dehydratase family protein n=1 Tax=unclassified Exiguobacterium TaxID=2644629 RepID=UPI000B5927CF|nr:MULTISPECIES: NAD-dependent epimerase/dehydratase family protein [unclassified Exiguobacterium]ASI36435.1 NAD-dependent epimerase [Exiguobacterium sp. N4-1P]